MSMDTVDIRMSNLFLQLGLDATDEGIAQFIQQHHLDGNTYITDAQFWNNGQRQLLSEMLKDNAEWSVLVDQLNESLHA